jgi:hypothetical protein
LIKAEVREQFVEEIRDGNYADEPVVEWRVKRGLMRFGGLMRFVTSEVSGGCCGAYQQPVTRVGPRCSR